MGTIIRIAICHDFFDSKMIGGGETEMKMLAEGLKGRGHDVTLYCGYNRGFKIDVPIIEIGSWFNTPGLKQTELAMRFSKLDLKKYDVVISENYWSSFVNHPNHLHHCEAPIRQFYDMRTFWSMKQSPLMRMFNSLWTEMMIPIEQKAIKKCRLIANSEFTKTRIGQYYDMNSTVIYPPIVTKNYKYEENGDWWLYVGRLDYNKRIEFMIDCFNKAKQKLIVIGDGPLRKKAEEMAGENITIKGFVPFDEVPYWYANCKATVYLPFFEDFGSVPVEGMAAGKPCLGVPEGGLLETIIPNETGWLLYPRTEDIVQMLNSITTEDCKKMRKKCEKHAKRFDIERYLDEWEALF